MHSQINLFYFFSWTFPLTLGETHTHTHTPPFPHPQDLICSFIPLTFTYSRDCFRWSREPGAGSSIQISPLGGMNWNAWAITTTSQGLPWQEGWSLEPELESNSGTPVWDMGVFTTSLICLLPSLLLKLVSSKFPLTCNRWHHDQRYETPLPVHKGRRILLSWEGHCVPVALIASWGTAKEEGIYKKTKCLARGWTC